MMQQDIRETSLYREAENLFRALRQPGSGQITDASEINVSPGGEHAVFTGTFTDKLEGAPATRICQVHLTMGDMRVLTFGPNADRLAKYSPDGRLIAFLSDRHKTGDFQLHLLDPPSGGARPAPHVDGWVEYLHWSPDGSSVLLGVAGHGADVSGGQGAITSKRVMRTAPSWMPDIQIKDESYRWRRAWIYDVASGHLRPVGAAATNVWEAVWCGNSALAAVISPGPGEGLWYSARLSIIDIESGESREAHAPRYQIGWPAASPSGSHLAFVEAVCSDRWVVAGDVRLIDVESGNTVPIDTRGVDITYTEWRSDQVLMLAGHRGFDSVVGLYDTSSRVFKELWSSTETTTGGRYIVVSGIGESGDCALIGESFVRAPEVALIRRGHYQRVRSFDTGCAPVEAVAGIERIVWTAPDGLEIQGWLLRPRSTAPHPLVMAVHGGPVFHWRPVWLGRAYAALLMLINHGYAVFLPNPRGSAGRGQDFVGRVLGDIGGADTYDYLSGLSHLVERGIADPDRLGVTGVSYGGFMAAWLITQDPRFAAAVPVAPLTNQVTEHLISNIPHFVALFLGDTYTNAAGKYYQRSPVLHAHKTRTPTLNICGALDRCTPPEEAVQFHSALLENGVESVLAVYPEEGHGIRKLPAAIDYVARVVGWFEQHMPARA